MYNITFNQNGETIAKEFETYFHLIKFVAENNIQDQDFVSLNLEGEEIIGMDGLITKAVEVADNGIAAYERAMAEEFGFEE